MSVVGRCGVAPHRDRGCRRGRKDPIVEILARNRHLHGDMSDKISNLEGDFGLIPLPYCDGEYRRLA
jgi:hypothetical protein